MADAGHAFFRHGDYAQRRDVPSARQPWPLTEKGIAQARAGAPLLHAMLCERDLPLAPVIHCSRQLRAWQTADLLAEGLRALGHEITELRETPALAERGLGEAANLTVDEIEAALAADPRYQPLPAGWKSDSGYCLPCEGAESLLMAGARGGAPLGSHRRARPCGRPRGARRLVPPCLSPPGTARAPRNCPVLHVSRPAVTDLSSKRWYVAAPGWCMEDQGTEGRAEGLTL